MGKVEVEDSESNHKTREDREPAGPGVTILKDDTTMNQDMQS